MGIGGTLGAIAVRVVDRRFGFASPRGGRLRFRVVSAAAIVLGLLAFGAAPALAAQRYAAPTPAGTKDCSSAANACGLATAIEGAAKGDEVIVEPGSSGSYGTAGTPLSSTVQSGTEDLDVHGVEISPGPPGEDPAIQTADHPHPRMNPTYDPRGYAYEHIQVLMEHLKRFGHEPAIDLPDDAFDELERVEP